MTQDLLYYYWDLNSNTSYSYLELSFAVDLKGEEMRFYYLKIPEEETYEEYTYRAKSGEICNIKLIHPEDLISAKNRVLPELEVRVNDQIYPLFDLIKNLVNEKAPEYKKQCELQRRKPDSSKPHFTEKAVAHPPKDLLYYHWDTDPDVDYSYLELYFDVDLKGQEARYCDLKGPEEGICYPEMYITENGQICKIMLTLPEELISSKNCVLPDMEVRFQDQVYPLYDLIKYLIDKECQRDPGYAELCEFQWKKQGRN